MGGYKFIEKNEIEEVINGFKHYNKDCSYIMPDGNVSRLAKNQKNYAHKVTKRFYMEENDAKKRVSVTNIEPITNYHVWKIFETTDKELEPFIGKCLVQKEDEKHQSITKPGAVFKYMLDNFAPAYEHTKVQLTNQEVLSHFKSTDCIVEAKAQLSP